MVSNTEVIEATSVLCFSRGAITILTSSDKPEHVLTAMNKTLLIDTARPDFPRLSGVEYRAH